MIQDITFGQNPLFGWRDRVQTSFFVKIWHSKCWCDLENVSRSSKSNNFCPMSKWCFHTSLVKIHRLVQEIVCRQGSFYSPYSVVTLKIRSMSPKSDQIFKLSQRYKIWSVARIRHLVQEIRCRQDLFDQIWKFYSFYSVVTLKIRSRSLKSN